MQQCLKTIVEVVRLGRMIAVQNPNGGVRGIVAIVRRLVARTIAQQFSTEVERAIAPFQWSLTSKAGGECMVHAF